MEQKIRLLRADEIECRIATIKNNGLSLLLYKDARVDQKILDETFGTFGWKRSHQSIDGNLYCTVEVYDSERNEWVAKQDVGTMGYTEKEKSQASDSFKRACFNWGIGRELYSAPFIWISSEKAGIRNDNGKASCFDRFSVANIAYNESREIVGLIVLNESTGQIVYEMKPKGTRQNAKTTSSKEIQKGKMSLSENQIDHLENELRRTGVKMAVIEQRYGISEISDMSPEIYNKVMSALSKTKTSNVA